MTSLNYQLEEIRFQRQTMIVKTGVIGPEEFLGTDMKKYIPLKPIDSSLHSEFNNNCKIFFMIFETLIGRE